MKLTRISVILILMLIGISIGWPLGTSHADGQGKEAACAKPPGAKCGSKTIIVYEDGLHGRDSEIFVCRGDKVDWQVDTTSGNVDDFTVHFDENPFDRGFGRGDYCAGKHCAGHQHGTDKLAARTKSSDPNYVRCHKYTLTVAKHDGSKLPIDPHIIVGTGGTTQ